LSGGGEIEEDDPQTLSILGITPYLMSLYPLITFFYLSFPIQTLGILGITPYLMSLYPLIILFYLSSPLKH
jgi:polyferredoxin